MHRPSLPVFSGDKDRALDAALTQLVPRGLAERSGVSALLPPANEIVAPDVHVTAVRRLPAEAAQYVAWPEAVHPEVVAALARRGIEQVYSHQAEAMRHALGGQHVVVVTPTASGKTLCYNGPVLTAILNDPASRALYLFPTKALAQDQLAELHGLSESIAGETGSTIGVFTYDGDTPQDARRAIRQQAHVVLSNPDMLHAGVLPHHPKWAKLFENLRYIVIDELHAYRGVFGSHLANILRRLQRICRHYGSDPTFICCSATIANPKALAEALTEQPFALVNRNGAPRGEKFFLFVNPPVVNEALGIRRSYLAETRRVALEFLQALAPDHRLRAEPALDRDPDDLLEGCVRRPARHRGSDPRDIAAATCRCGGARSSAGCARATCAPSCRRVRSNSASTSARSTSRCWRDTPARLPARGSARAARDVGRPDRRRSWSPRARRSTSSSSGIRRTSSTRHPSMR